MIFHSDLLHAQVLFSRDGKPGPGFDRLVIRYYYTLPVADVSDTRYRAAGRASSLFFIHVISGKSADLDKRASFIDEVADAFSRGELILFPLLVNRFFPTPQCDLVQPGSHLAERPLHGIFIFIKIYIHGKQFIMSVLWTRRWKRLRPQFNMDDLIFGVFLNLCSVKLRQLGYASWSWRPVSGFFPFFPGR